MRVILRGTVSAMALMMLLACAPAKPVVPAASAPAVPTANAQAAPAPISDAVVSLPTRDFAGLWYVSGVYPMSAKHASVADPHMGAALVIDAAEVSDVNGQRCITPAFQADKTDAQGLGLKAAPSASWDRLLVSCDGKAFATYILVPTKSGLAATGMAPKHALLQLRPEALYLLEQAGDILHRLPNELLEEPVALTGEGAPALEAALPEPAPQIAKITETPKVAEKPKAKSAPVELAPKTAPEGPVAALPEATQKSVSKVTATDGAKIPAAGTAMHLASYKGESAAKRGWKILLGEYDELDPLSPLYVPVDIPGKGAIIRLYATGANNAGLTKICAELKAKQVYCTLNP